MGYCALRIPRDILEQIPQLALRCLSPSHILDLLRAHGLTCVGEEDGYPERCGICRAAVLQEGSDAGAVQGGRGRVGRRRTILQCDTRNVDDLVRNGLREGDIGQRIAKRRRKDGKVLVCEFEECLRLCAVLPAAMGQRDSDKGGHDSPVDAQLVHDIPDLCQCVIRDSDGEAVDRGRFAADGAAEGRALCCGTSGEDEGDDGTHGTVYV